MQIRHQKKEKELKTGAVMSKAVISDDTNKADDNVNRKQMKQGLIGKS